MLILTDYNKPYIIESLTSPIVPEYYWMLSGKMMDFALCPIVYLEETIGPTIEFVVDGNVIHLPTSWYVLIVEPDTGQLDTIPVLSCSKASFSALLFTTQDTKFRHSELRVSNLDDNKSLVHPMMEKGTMMCIPVGPDGATGEFMTICAGPYDVAAKHFNGANVADLMY
jgi:hypothetical protein